MRWTLENGLQPLLRPEVFMTLRKTTLVLTFVATALILAVTPGIAQVPLETASTGIIQPGDVVAVRCFTHE